LGGIISFAQNEGDNGTTGFIRVDNGGLYPDNGGLYRIIDGGQTWQRVSTEIFSHVTMGTDRRGVAARGGALLQTTNGGERWDVTDTLDPVNRFPRGLHTFDRDRYSVIVPDRYQRNSRGLAGHSSDGGGTWGFRQRAGEQMGITEPFFWLSPKDVYCTNDGRILYSSDSGVMFSDIRGEWGQSRVATRDERYIYLFASDSARVGRWLILEGTSSVVVRLVDTGDLRASIIGNPSSDGVVQVRYTLPSSSLVEIELVDMRGWVMVTHRLDEQPSGEHTMVMDIQGIPSGRYLVRLGTNGDVVKLPLVVVR
jgi:photosystem II stability/assembly factor-like uncharacterized protein